MFNLKLHLYLFCISTPKCIIMLYLAESGTTHPQHVQLLLLAKFPSKSEIAPSSIILKLILFSQK